MKEIVNELYKLYKAEKYQFEYPENLGFKSKQEDAYIIDISLVKEKNDYYIFLYISEDNKLKFKGLFETSNESLEMEFNKLCNDLSNFNMTDFLKKYYIILKTMNM